MTDLSPSAPARRGFEARVRLAPVAAVLGLALVVAALASGWAQGISWPGAGAAYGLAAAAVVATVIGWRGKSNLGLYGAWTLSIAAAAVVYWNLILHVSRTAEAAQVAFHAAALAAAVVPLIGFSRLVSPAKATLVGCSAAAALLAFEWLALARSLTVDEAALHDIQWAGEGWHFEKHPVLGQVYWPWGWMKAWYPTNERNYFEVETPTDAVDMRSFRIDAVEHIVLEVVRPETPDGVLSLTYRPGDGPSAPPVAVHAGLPVVPGQEYRLSFEARSAGGRQRVSARVDQWLEGKSEVLATEEFGLGEDWREFSLPATALRQPGSAFVRLSPVAPLARLEVRQVQFVGQRPLPQPKQRYAVSYNFNGDGFRDRPWRLEAASGVTRVAMLGDSFTVGYGVHARDLASRRLEDELNSGRSSPGYEVMNFGTIGFSSRQERACFNLCVAKYRPQIVLLMMVANDPVSMEEETELGATHLWKKMQQSSGLTREMYRRRWEAIEEIKQQYEEKCVPEILGLVEECRLAGAKLLVVYYRFSDEANWQKMVRVVDAALEGRSVPTIDLYPALRAEHDFESLKVHAVDGHPNEIANRVAATELARKLRELGWLSDAEGTSAAAETAAAEANAPADTAPPSDQPLNSP